jgi:hypothetical protein
VIDSLIERLDLVTDQADKIQEHVDKHQSYIDQSTGGKLAVIQFITTIITAAGVLLTAVKLLTR